LTLFPVPCQLATSRLFLLALEGSQVTLLLDDPEKLEDSLGLQQGYARLSDELRGPVNSMRQATLRDPANTLWTTNWQIVTQDTLCIVGGFCFKGPPNDLGEVEIGYGLNPGNEGNGYMSEAVSEAVLWALQQPGVRAVMAETDLDNWRSHAVLQRTGFKRARDTESACWWRREG
jgi:[ribosomal protein S5]-alanine N-acetyltransferase